MRWKIIDKKVAKRTAIQETVIEPVRASHFVTKIQGRSSERTVFAMNKFTIPDGKKLVVELFEKNGGRHQSFTVGKDDIIQVKAISNFKEFDGNGASQIQIKAYILLGHAYVELKKTHDALDYYKKAGSITDLDGAMAA